ncbi:hypothetical protein Dimus_015473 [Dionaea muscipula]
MIVYGRLGGDPAAHGQPIRFSEVHVQPPNGGSLRGPQRSLLELGLSFGWPCMIDYERSARSQWRYERRFCRFLGWDGLGFSVGRTGMSRPRSALAAIFIYMVWQERNMRIFKNIECNPMVVSNKSLPVDGFLMLFFVVPLVFFRSSSVRDAREDILQK